MRAPKPAFKGTEVVQIDSLPRRMHLFAIDLLCLSTVPPGPVFFRKAFPAQVIQYRARRWPSAMLQF